MGTLEAVLALLVLDVVVALALDSRIARSGDEVDEVLGSAHEAIDEIELARVRSMLQRR